MERLPGDQPAKAEIGEALERADAVLISGRDRVSQLRALDAGDLAEALVSAARAAAVHSDASFKFDIAGAVRPVRPIVIEELDAMGAEAITNAFRHAKANTIRVMLGYGQNDLTLDILDDGIGIDAKILAQGGREGHFGFTGMRERAEKLGAKLSIASVQEHGCTISIIVPARVAYLPDQWPWPVRIHHLLGRRAAPVNVTEDSGVSEV
jgi:signal transduction histidine kinase